MPESTEHRSCKELLAEITGCKTETYISPRRRADVACNENLFFEINCKRKSSGERVCLIEPRIKMGEKEYPLGKLSCDKLRP